MILTKRNLPESWTRALAAPATVCSTVPSPTNMVDGHSVNS